MSFFKRVRGVFVAAFLGLAAVPGPWTRSSAVASESVIPVHIRLPIDSIKRDLVAEITKGRPEAARVLPYPGWQHGSQLIKDIPTNTVAMVPHTTIIKETINVPRTITRTVREMVPENRRILVGILFPIAFFDTVLVEKVSEVTEEVVVPVVRDIEKTVMEPVNKLTALDVEFSYDLNFDRLDVSAKDGMITVVADLGVNMQGKLARVGPVPAGITQSQDGRVQVRMTKKPRWTDNGRIELVEGNTSVDWTVGGVLSAFNFDFASVLNKQILKMVANEVLERVLAGKLGDLDPLGDVVAQHLKDQAVGEEGDLWLRFNARQLLLAPWSVDQDSATATIHLIASPALVSGEKPECDDAPTRKAIRAGDPIPSPRLELAAHLTADWMERRFPGLIGKNFGYAPRLQCRDGEIALTFGSEGGATFQTAIRVAATEDGRALNVARVKPVDVTPDGLLNQGLARVAALALDHVPTIPVMAIIEGLMKGPDEGKSPIRIELKDKKIAVIESTTSGLNAVITAVPEINYVR